ncbi:claret [Anaeramoeba flamelloides]|uniref:Claret n=1 Tax=Anaeramoeba flamelloides TaxID=1746091 RepID=A0ABQ8ZC03_9EUKA|nr:claret [Anaeramoeba flamelloides]
MDFSSIFRTKKLFLYGKIPAIEEGFRGTKKYTSKPIQFQLDDFNSVLKVTANRNAMCVLLPNKQLLEINFHYDETCFRSVDIGSVIDVKSGWEFTIALCESGDVYGWGSSFGNKKKKTVEPTLLNLKTIEKLKEFYVACYSIYFLAENGDLYALDLNQFGQSLTQKEKFSCPPSKIASSVERVFIGNRDIIYFIQNGVFKTRGSNVFTGDKGLTINFKASDVKDIRALKTFDLLLTNNGELYHRKRQYYMDHFDNQFKKLEFFANKKVKQLTIGTSENAILLENGDIYLFGVATSSNPNYGTLQNKYTLVTPKIDFPIEDIAIGYPFYLLITKNITPLESDFGFCFHNKELADSEILKIPVYSLLIELRTEQSFSEIKLKLEKNFSKEQIKIFLLWVYTDQITKDYSILLQIMIKLEIKNRINCSLRHDLKLLYNEKQFEKFHDFSITMGNTSIPVHKLILIVRSGLYRELCLNLDTETVSLPDVTGKSLRGLQLLIEFIYTNDLTLNESDDFDLLYEELRDCTAYYMLNEKCEKKEKRKKKKKKQLKNYMENNLENKIEIIKENEEEKIVHHEEKEIKVVKNENENKNKIQNRKTNENINEKGNKNEIEKTMVKKKTTKKRLNKQEKKREKQRLKRKWKKQQQKRLKEKQNRAKK